MVITRFAPSPTGRLHIGHVYSAFFAYELAMQNDGRFILRIEDIDKERCHKKYEDGIYEDLSWLGLKWETPVRRQSEHMDEYKSALKKLEDKELLYPCFCTRKEIREEAKRSGSAPHGPEGVLYPGICKTLSKTEIEDKMQRDIPFAMRLDLNKALTQIDKPLYWHDEGKGKQLAEPEILGDAVLARKDISASYHLSVCLDDHLQEISLVTRGDELFYASHLHRVLQELLDLEVPQYHHHKLLLDEKGDKLSKRENAACTIQSLRENEHKSPADVRALIGV